MQTIAEEKIVSTHSSRPKRSARRKLDVLQSVISDSPIVKRHEIAPEHTRNITIDLSSEDEDDFKSTIGFKKQQKTANSLIMSSTPLVKISAHPRIIPSCSVASTEQYECELGSRVSVEGDRVEVDSSLSQNEATKQQEKSKNVDTLFTYIYDHVCVCKFTGHLVWELGFTKGQLLTLVGHKSQLYGYNTDKYLLLLHI